MSFLNPASISLNNGEDLEGDEGIPAVGASVIIQDDDMLEVLNDNIGEADENELIESEGGVSSSVFHFGTGPRIRKSQHDGRFPIMCKEEPLESRRMRSVITPDKITTKMYNDFVTVMTGGIVSVTDLEYRQQLDALVDGQEYSVACGIQDEILGPLEYVIINLQTKKILLTVEQRQMVLEAVVERFKNDRNPIGSCLEYIQKSYIGFQPVIKLRNALLDCFNQVAPHSIQDVEAKIDENVTLGSENDVNSDKLNAEPTGMPDFRRTARSSRAFASINPNTPVPDNQYDLLAQVVAGRIGVDDIDNWIVREAIKARLGAGLVAEKWDEPGEFLRAGWRLRMKDSGKIVPRRSEVDEIWRQCCEVLGQDCPQREIVNYLEARYIGVCAKARVRFANKDVLFKGTRVQFPAKPRCIGSKPMQYVQIDMVDMENSEYGDRCYTMALIVTDLYSQFVFGRALADTSDSSLLVRHLMDIFGAFAPPEVYRSYTNNVVIEQVMNDVERLFKVHIKNVGQGIMCHYNLRASVYKRAEEELGSRERWVEALPFAIIEYNQRPLKGFSDIKISPFEIMFGRRPWKKLIFPPWIQPKDGNMVLDGECDYDFDFEHSRTMEETEKAMDAEIELAGGLLQKPMRNDPGFRLTNIYLNDISECRGKISHSLGRYPAKFNEDGELIDPGTGFMFEIGDKVYMRNVLHKDIYNKSKKRTTVPRYFRATIAEIDFFNSEFTYRVNFWDDVSNVDSMPSDQWPNENCQSAWVSPYDITPSTPGLSRKRNIVRRREMEYQCKCGYDFCELVFNEKCPYKLSQACCQRLKMHCPFHSGRGLTRTARRDPAMRGIPARTFVQHELRRSVGSIGAVGNQMFSTKRDTKTRWVYQDGRLIEYAPFATPTTLPVHPPQQLHIPEASGTEAFQEECMYNEGMVRCVNDPNDVVDPTVASDQAGAADVAGTNDPTGSDEEWEKTNPNQDSAARLIPFHSSMIRKKDKTPIESRAVEEAKVRKGPKGRPRGSGVAKSKPALIKPKTTSAKRTNKQSYSTRIAKRRQAEEKLDETVVKEENVVLKRKRISAPPRRLSPDPSGSH